MFPSMMQGPFDWSAFDLTGFAVRLRGGESVFYLGMEAIGSQ
jgi:hypothetical protein